MLSELNGHYKSITQNQIKFFLSLCELCQQMKKKIKKGLVVKPMISAEFNSRCQIDLIDFHPQPDGDFKYVLNYQDHLTEFVILRPLKTKTAVAVAYEVLNIFLLFGAQFMLQRDNGRENK